MCSTTRTHRGDDDIEDLAKSVGVLKLCFAATCAGCNTPLSDSSQIMCTRCTYGR